MMMMMIVTMETALMRMVSGDDIHGTSDMKSCTYVRDSEHAAVGNIASISTSRLAAQFSKPAKRQSGREVLHDAVYRNTSTLALTYSDVSGSIVDYAMSFDCNKRT
jgi:hypothetical protein